MSRSLSLSNEPMMVENDPRDTQADRDMAGRVGSALSFAYPGWCWKVEIPPNQQVIIVRCLTVNLRGNYGYSIHRHKVSDEIRACLIGAGALLERYEHQKKHPGKFRPDDVSEMAGMLVKPQI
jgi:hypothetical protein